MDTTGNPRANPSPPVYAGAVVSNSEGEVLCQLRDDKPGIRFPGFWSCSPGGHVEPEESPRHAIVRELREEFEIEITHLKPLAVLVETEEEISGVYNAFSAEMATPVEQLKCNEGQRAGFFSIDEALQLRLHPVSRKILMKYLSLRAKGKPA